MDKIKSIVQTICTRETITYLIFGGMTTLISMVSFSLCVGAMSVWASNTISTLLAVTFAFITNKIWVFESRDFRPAQILKELAKFCAGRFLTYVLETSLLQLLIEILGFNSILCKLFTQAITIVLNYIVSKKAVFNK